jgi:RNA polymerase primary sigma factor
MSIDLHETAATTHKAAKLAQRRAIEGIEAARAVDLQTPAAAAKQVAKRTAKKAAKAAAKEAAKRTAEIKQHAPHRRKAKRSRGRKLFRVLLIAGTVGALTAVAITVARRMGAGQTGLAVSDTPDPFGAAVNATDDVDADALLRHAESPT